MLLADTHTRILHFLTEVLGLDEEAAIDCIEGLQGLIDPDDEEQFITLLG